MTEQEINIGIDALDRKHHQDALRKLQRVITTMTDEELIAAHLHNQRNVCSDLTFSKALRLEAEIICNENTRRGTNIYEHQISMAEAMAEDDEW